MQDRVDGGVEGKRSAISGQYSTSESKRLQFLQVLLRADC